MAIVVGTHTRHLECTSESHPVDWEDLAERIVWWYENGNRSMAWAAVNGLMADSCAIGRRFALLETAIKGLRPELGMNDLMGFSAWWVSEILANHGSSFPDPKVFT